MLAGAIAAYEDSTHNFLNSTGKLAAGTEGTLGVFDVRPGYSSYYKSTTTTKERIVLHYTTGFLGGDISTLTTAGTNVSVSYVVARNGKIYRLFPSEKWSYHTGPGTVGGNTDISRSSIGIEISNIGYLEQAGSWMWNYYGDRYCRVSETGYYNTLPAPFRGKEHYATYTNAQYVSVKALIDVLVAKHSIPRVLLPAATRYSVFPNAAAGRAFRGICSHVNYRPSGKWDIGPAFNWLSI